jgi:hypothetical protein
MEGSVVVVEQGCRGSVSEPPSVGCGESCAEASVVVSAWEGFAVVSA